MSRLEAAVKAWDHFWGDRYGDEALEEMGDEVKVALAAADAHDRANGIHRLTLSDATVERAARRLYADSGTGKADEWVYMPPEDECRRYFMNLASRALAAAVKEEQA
jgi:hypothetical protein